MEKFVIGGGTKHKLIAVLLCFAVAISGWVIPSRPAYAAVTARISGGYLYVPTSVGCPVIYHRYDCYRGWYVDGEYESYLAYSDISTTPSFNYYGDNGPCSGLYFPYRAIDYNSPWGNVPSEHYYIQVNNPVIDGSNIRYNVVGVVCYKVGTDEDGDYWRDVFSVSRSLPGSIPIDSNGSHSLSTLVASATCTSPATYSCSKCGSVAPSGNALGHSFTVKQTAATCTTNQINKCSRCSATQAVANTALGHSYGNWITDTDATPYSIGSKHRVCARNNSHIETGTIPQKHFQIYNGNSRVNKIYLGNALIMDANAGTEPLVK